MLEKHFVFNGTYESLKIFGNQLNAVEVHKGRLLIEEENIQGWLRHLEVEPGLYIQTTDVYIKCPLVLKKAADVSALHRYYSISYFLSPQTLSISIDDNDFEAVKNLHKLNNFFSENASFIIKYEKENALKNLTLIFSDSWLLQHLNASTGKELDIFQVFENQQYIFHYNNNSNSEEIEAKELFKEVNSFQSLLLIKSHVYDLIYRILFTVAKLKKDSKAKELTTNYSMLVKEVEKIINLSLKTNMPSITEIAKRLFVSESTLKRQFKKVYGVNIYHYYLEMKMKKAEEMLTENKMNISQVASSLGYESVSHFTVLFKKFYKKLPSHVRKPTINF